MSPSIQSPCNIPASGPTRAARGNSVLRCLLRPAVVATVIAVLLGILPGLGNAHAEQRGGCVTTTLQVNIFGSIPARMTFWVAYGPVAGRFHAVQLHRTSPGVYSAHRSLPIHQSKVFTYLTARGAVRTPAGFAPGNDITVIDAIGPVSPERLTAHQVSWRQPAG